MAFASMNQDADRLGFVYGPVSPPVVLDAGKTYYVLDVGSSASSDTFHNDVGTVLQTSSAATVAGSVYGSPGALKPGGGGPTHAYGPANVLFS